MARLGTARLGTDRLGGDGPTDHAVNAGDSSFAFAVPQPTVTRTAAPTVALVLSDFVLADGLETEVLGLIEAAAPIDVFSRSPRTARGTLVDGELDLSGDSEPVTRFRFRAQATNTAGGARITLNDSGTLSCLRSLGPVATVTISRSGCKPRLA